MLNGAVRNSGLIAAPANAVALLISGTGSVTATVTKGIFNTSNGVIGGGTGSIAIDIASGGIVEGGIHNAGTLASPPPVIQVKPQGGTLTGGDRRTPVSLRPSSHAEKISLDGNVSGDILLSTHGDFVDIVGGAPLAGAIDCGNTTAEQGQLPAR